LHRQGDEIQCLLFAILKTSKTEILLIRRKEKFFFGHNGDKSGGKLMFIALAERTRKNVKL
jgi:hypothetical protein